MSPARAKVVALLADIDWRRSTPPDKLFHKNGQPFTEAEVAWFDRSTPAEWVAANTARGASTLDETVAELIRRGRPVSGEEFLAHALRLGRSWAPALLFDLAGAGLLSGPDLARAVDGAWCAHDFPQRVVETEVWLDWFAETGYIVGGVPATRPNSVPRLFRGASADAKAGMAWTSRLEVAASFADRYRDLHKRPVAVWTCTPEPCRLLAQVGGRDEGEFVLDTDGLPIVEQRCRSGGLSDPRPEPPCRSQDER